MKVYVVEREALIHNIQAIRRFAGPIPIWGVLKGNGYGRGNHEEGRKALNEWIRTSREFDGVIDFDAMVRDTEDPERLNPAFLFENDWLHLNASGYEVMGKGIDVNLFK